MGIFPLLVGRQLEGPRWGDEGQDGVVGREDSAAAVGAVVVLVLLILLILLGGARAIVGRCGWWEMRAKRGAVGPAGAIIDRCVRVTEGAGSRGLGRCGWGWGGALCGCGGDREGIRVGEMGPLGGAAGGAAGAGVCATVGGCAVRVRVRVRVGADVDGCRAGRGRGESFRVCRDGVAVG